MALGSSRHLTEMSTRNIPGGKGRPALKADNLMANCERFSRKWLSLDASQPYGPPRSVTGIALFFTIFIKRSIQKLLTRNFYPLFFSCFSLYSEVRVSYKLAFSQPSNKFLCIHHGQFQIILAELELNRIHQPYLVLLALVWWTKLNYIKKPQAPSNCNMCVVYREN
jgi:hypothetical protein